MLRFAKVEGKFSDHTELRLKRRPAEQEFHLGFGQQEFIMPKLRAERYELYEDVYFQGQDRSVRGPS